MRRIDYQGNRKEPAVMWASPTVSAAQGMQAMQVTPHLSQICQIVLPTPIAVQLLSIVGQKKVWQHRTKLAKG
jgi:hypothetical protein